MKRPIYISADTCEELLDPQSAAELAERALAWEAAGKVTYGQVRALKMKVPDTGFRFHSKVVALPELGVAGARVVGYTTAPDGSRPRASETTRLIVLMDIHTGVPLAIVDEHYNYALRTAASVGVAARIVRPEVPTLGMIGAGVVARAGIKIMLTQLKVERLLVHSRTLARCQALVELAATMAPTVDVTIAESSAQVLAESDLVVMATTASSPIQVGPLPEGLVICALGSNEIDAAGYLSADHFIVDDWAQTKAASDIAAMLEAGHDLAGRLTATLPELVHNSAPNWSDNDSVIIRTEGMASQDIAFAHHAWREYTQ
ncbi:hypothetical protein CQY20_04345 [Mycolicibacterium agri]|uniref:N-[(2S)-2-amino-2-carboxyethyl]-L-glutamate dehydrogenase SbnB n=1 Tax=Mycolicibacterium agri TaxID=36811 RepID=A0A2A7NCV6_MYCAG|nr:hypothetical protein [Mycolicibacterium agri]PEG41690.1 hypothetical protein CQY20_04345 [Mycolicibacterium agri]GFG50086.1 N-[(2S)-2-amino-2-carboxyethyl]-L-glutamate dehydrogenase SbnB [Mycolicibacterium agri]